MSTSKGIIIMFLVLTLIFPNFISEASTTYSDWSVWQTTPIYPSETVEVDTRVTNVTEGTKTTYFYEYWRYWNASANKYLYKGNGNAGGTYYSITRTEKLNYYKDTSDGPSYLVGGGGYFNFKGELWFNEKAINNPTVRQITEYRSRTKIESVKDNALQPPAPTSPPTPTTGTGATTPGIDDAAPGPINYVACSKSQYTEKESIVISWSSTENASKYGLTVRISPYSGDSSIKYNRTLNGNSVSIGTLPPGSYRFAMRAYNSSGDMGLISKQVYFTVVKEAGLSSIRTPIDLNGETWKGITYGGSEKGHGEHWGTSYRAVDLNLPNNGDAERVVYAIASGKVIALYADYGEVIIEHDVRLVLSDGSKTYHKWYSLYAHMKDIKVKKGDTVTQNTVLGTLWSTGAKKGNEHLHFAITTKLGTNGSLVNNSSSDYNNYTISPIWLGGDYGNIIISPYSGDQYDAEAASRHSMSQINLAPASN